MREVSRVENNPPRFRPLPAQVSLPDLDHEVLTLWRERDVFARSLAQTAGGALWVFYEGPPTANGRPGRTTSRRASSKTSSRATRP